MWTRVLIVAIAGALGAVLANRGIAVFHDGLRSLMPELEEGRMRRSELVSHAFGLSFGLAVAFGIPFSLTSAILLNHSLWLGTDVIGTWFPGPLDRDSRSHGKSSLSLVGVIVAGALYGGLLAAGLGGFVRVCERLPVDILGSMGQFRDPIIFTYAVFPAVAVAYQYGIKKGGLAFLLTLLGRQIASALGQAQPDGWALAVGMLVLVLCAIPEKRGDGARDAMATLWTERASRIRGYLPAVAVLGAVYGLACQQAIMMEGPQSLVALAQGKKAAAIHFALARALAFMPLKAMSVLVTGVFATDGLGFVATAGLVSPNELVAAIAGAVIMSAEALGLVAVARFFHRFQAMSTAADNIRTAMTKLLELSSFVGGMMAASNMAPGLGLLFVAGLYLLNESAGTPVVRAAVGPVGVILVGILDNLAALLQGAPPV